MSVNTIDNNSVSGNTMANVAIPNTSNVTNNSDYQQNINKQPASVAVPNNMPNIVIPPMSLNAPLPPAAFAIDTPKMNISAPSYFPTIPVVTPNPVVTSIPVVTPVPNSTTSVTPGVATTVQGLIDFNPKPVISAAEILSLQLQLLQSRESASQLQQILQHQQLQPSLEIEQLQNFNYQYLSELARQVYLQNLLQSVLVPVNPLQNTLQNIPTVQPQLQPFVLPNQTMTSSLQGEEQPFEDEIEQSIAQSPQPDEPCITGIDSNYGKTSDAEGGSDGSTISGISPRVGAMESTIGNTDTPKMTMDDNGERFIGTTSGNTQSMQTTNTNTTDTDGELQKDVDRINRMILADLNRLTPQNFGKLSQRISALLAKDPRIVLENVLRKAMKEPEFSKLYAQLCYSMYLDLQSEETQHSFRKTLFEKCYSGFKSTRAAAHGDHGKCAQFMGMITMIGELHNHYGLLTWKFVNRMLNVLLPPQHAVDIEAVYTLLKVAGRTLDHSRPQVIDSIISGLQTHALQFDTRTQFMVEEICEMRRNNWQQRIAQETPRRVDQRSGNSGYRNNYHGHRNVQRNGQRSDQWNKPRYNNNNNNYRGGDRYNSTMKRPTYRGYQKGYNGRKRGSGLNGKSVEFVRDVTLKDRSYYPQNMKLTKTWELKNAHHAPWGADVELVFFKGHEDVLLGKRYPVPHAMPGQTVQVSVELLTPILKDENEEGRRCAYFRLQKNGKFFGPRVWVDIIVDRTQIVGTDGSVSANN